MTGTRSLRAAAIPALALALATGCGQDEEERLRDAIENLTEAREAVQAAQEEVDEKQAAVDEARAELEKAREGLREARERQAAAESKVDLSATDDALFRTIQTRLLEDDDLEGAAISAQVSQGVVTLSGTVSKAEKRERAVEIARSVPGVSGVNSQIRVKGPPAAQEAP